MTLKNTVLVGVTVIGLAVGANQMLQPTTAEDLNQARQEQALDQAADADQKSKDTMRDNADGHRQAETERRLRPTEPRPNTPRIRLRIRP